LCDCGQHFAWKHKKKSTWSHEDGWIHGNKSLQSSMSSPRHTVLRLSCFRELPTSAC
jgi:hypothetical protein